MADLTNPRVIHLKAFLFLFHGILASALLVIPVFSVKNAVLLGIAIWSFCRYYYFAFYVIERYVDPGYRFAGFGSFLRHLIRSRSER